jgi:ribosomal-protein-alanine N-acetyltransferase
MRESLQSMKFMRMEKADLEDVLRIENSIYPFPWTKGNFVDSIDSGYETWVVRDGFNMIAGYFLMMLAVDEAHLLNITVRLDLQGQGVGRLLLNKVFSLAKEMNMQSLLLEVRPSNHHALAVYQHVGFNKIGIRKNYYPAPRNTREDAIVMRLEL